MALLTSDNAAITFKYTDLVSAQTALFRSAEYTDLVVKCKDIKWMCHRAVLCQRCPFFSAACRDGFQESQTRTIMRDDDDPNAIDAILVFLYTFEKPDFTKIASDTVRQILFAADKYAIKSLEHATLEFMARYYYNLMVKAKSSTPSEKQDIARELLDMWEWKQEGTKRLQEMVSKKSEGLNSLMRDEKTRMLLCENKALVCDVIKQMVMEIDSLQGGDITPTSKRPRRS